MQGTIKTIMNGFGFLRADGTDYFFHHTDLDGLRLKDLNEGDTLEFLPTEAAKGPRAAHVRPLVTNKAEGAPEGVSTEQAG